MSGKEGSSSDESEPFAFSEDKAAFEELQSQELAARHLQEEAKARSYAEAMEMRENSVFGTMDWWESVRDEDPNAEEVEALVWKDDHCDFYSQADVQAGEQASELEDVETLVLDEEENAEVSVDVLVGDEAYAEALVQEELRTSLLPQADILVEIEVLEEAQMQAEVERQAEARAELAEDNMQVHSRMRLAVPVGRQKRDV